MSRSSATSPGSFRLPHASHARVADAMHPGVVTCAPDTPLREIARTMATRHIHAVVVSTAPEHGTPPAWSVVSSLDLVAGVLKYGEEVCAGDVAASEPARVSSDDSLSRAAQLMAEHGVNHLIVVNAQDGHPVGVLSTLDVAVVLAWGEG
jgi:CBS domain-containing protein